ncbi:hypothetical protein LP419_35285 [Massilia sp. H-1]|nr:hypothetical protein LP419_35285 [Massilia sp. H-1]
MGARIGSVVQMQKGSVIRAQTNGSLIGMPDDGDTRVLAVSQIKLNLDGALFRFYLAKGDQDADEKFLQVYADPDGDIAEIMYCTQLARVVPETAEDQDAYTGVARRGPGRPVLHAVARAVGRPAQRCRPGHRVRRQRPHRLHARRLSNLDAAFVRPFFGKETRIDDAGGMQGLKQEMYYMPYVRELAGGGREYLIITTEIIDSVNGDTSKRGIHVDFVIGIPMEQERIVLQ